MDNNFKGANLGPNVDYGATQLLIKKATQPLCGPNLLDQFKAALDAHKLLVEQHNEQQMNNGAYCAWPELSPKNLQRFDTFDADNFYRKYWLKKASK